MIHVILLNFYFYKFPLKNFKHRKKEQRKRKTLKIIIKFTVNWILARISTFLLLYDYLFNSAISKGDLDNSVQKNLEDRKK